MRLEEEKERIATQCGTFYSTSCAVLRSVAMDVPMKGEREMAG
jgi:hypothetical protein